MPMPCNNTNVRYINNRFSQGTEGRVRCDNRFKTSPTKEFDWQELAQTANVLISIFDEENRICYANSSLEKITGYTKAELFKNKALLPQLRLLQQQANLNRDNSQAIVDREISFLTKKGNLCWLSCSIQATEFDRQPATLVTAVNITPYKQAQEQSQRVLEQERRQARNNMEFASMVSHELRTPLNIISLSSNLLQQYGNRWGKHKKQEYFNRIQRGVETISLLVDEVSIIGKASAQKLKFAPTKLDLQQFCQVLLEDLQLANGGQRRINFSILGDLRAFLDKSILQLVLTNLLENALKYSPQGQAVDFVVTASPEQITFKIRDGGIGISQRDLQKLFEPFYRGENVGQLPGNGLGLAVVKKLVQLHGGEITVNSQIKMGTEFIVSLPTN